MYITDNSWLTLYQYSGQRAGALDVLWGAAADAQQEVVTSTSVRLDLGVVRDWIDEVRRVRDAGDAGSEVRRRLADALRTACHGWRAPQAVERRHGGCDWIERQRSGGLLIYHGPRGSLREVGSRARAQQGVAVGWCGTAYALDDEAWPTAGGVRLVSTQGLPPVVELFVRAREQLRDAPLVCWASLSAAERREQEKHTFVDVQNSRHAFAKALAVQQQWGAEAAVTLDGSFLPLRPDPDPHTGVPRPRAARAGLWHDGQVQSAGMVEGQDTSCYLPEFAAQLEAARAVRARRLIVFFDSTSPLEAVLHFGRTHDRRKGDFYCDDWLAEWWALLDAYDVVVFVHVKSHIGIVVNEAADVLAKAALEEATQRVEVRSRPHVQLSFTGSGGLLTGAERVQLAAQSEVLARLRRAVVDSQWPRQGDVQPRELGLSREQWDVMLAMRGLRFFPAERKTYQGRAGRWVRAAPVHVMWQWWSAFMFATELLPERRGVLEVLLRGATGVDVDVEHPCTAWRDALVLMRAGVSGQAPQGGWEGVTAEDRVEALRVLTGMVRGAAASAVSVGWIESLCRAVARLAWRARALTQAGVQAGVEEGRRLEGMAGAWGPWARNTARMGPLRIAGLRALRRGWQESQAVVGERLAPDGIGDAPNYLGRTIPFPTAARLRLAFREARVQAAREAGGDASAWAADWWLAVARLIRVRRRARWSTRGDVVWSERGERGAWEDSAEDLFGHAALGAGCWRRVALGALFGLTREGSVVAARAPPTAELLRTLSGLEVRRWYDLEQQARDESEWTWAGAHRAIMRALRAWLLAGGGGEQRPLEERRRKRAADVRRLRQRRDVQHMEDSMWMYRHSRLRGVPSPPEVPVESRVHMVCATAVRGAGRQVRGAAARAARSGYLHFDAAAALRRRQESEAERRQALVRRQAEQAERQRRMLRQRRVRELRRLSSERDAAAEAEARRLRWAEQQLRAQREAVWRAHMESDAASRMAAEQQARAARFERARMLRQRAALRKSLGDSIRLYSVGTHRPDLGSSRANLLVRRARYLYGRSDLRHLLVRLGLSAS